MKWLVDYQYVRGLTLLVCGVYPLSTRDHLMLGERPHFGPVNPLWDFLPDFHRYVARLGYLLSCGTGFYDVGPSRQGSDTMAKIAESPVLPTPTAMRGVWTDIVQGRSGRLLAEPPFVPPPHPAGQMDASYRYRQWNYWMMSQRGGTLSYLTFSAGLSLGLFLVFHGLWDFLGLSSGVLRTLGTNALAGYVLHMLVADAVQPFMPRDAPAWYVWAGCALYLLITYALLRSLERGGVYLRL